MHIFDDFLLIPQITANIQKKKLNTFLEIQVNEAMSFWINKCFNKCIRTVSTASYHHTPESLQRKKIFESYSTDNQEKVLEQKLALNCRFSMM